MSEGTPARPTRASAIAGARWGAVSAIIEQGGTFLSTAVLARLLSPSEFGIVAAATIVVTLFALVGGVGLGANLIRSDEVDQRMLASTFWSAAAMGLVLSSLCAVGAPLFARLLGQPSVTPYLVVLSPVLLIGMLSNVSEAVLQRRLQFSAVYSADVAAVLVNLVASIGLAVGGFGAWALVVGRLSGALAGTAYRLFAARWRPTWQFDRGFVRSGMRFNLGFLGISLGNFTYKNLDNWVVSRTQSTDLLGAYYVAYLVPNILRQRMTWLANEILFPMMSRATGSEQQRKMYEYLVRLLSMVAFPVLIGVAAIAPEVVAIGFGPQWGAAVDPMRILSVAAAVDVLSQVAFPVFLSRGKPGVANRVLVVRIVLLAIGLGIGTLMKLGLDGVAWAVLGSTVASTALVLVGLRAVVDIAPLGLLRDLAPATIGCVVMFASTEVVRSTLMSSWSPAARLVGLVALGASAFVLTASIVDRSAVREAYLLVRQVVGRRGASA